MSLLETAALGFIVLLIVGVLVSMVVGTVIVAMVWKLWSKVLSFDEKF